MAICRRKLDEDRGNPWICDCPICREARKAERPREKEGEENQGIEGVSDNSHEDLR